MKHVFAANTLYTYEQIHDGIDEYNLTKDLCKIYGIKEPEDADNSKLNFTEAMMLVSIAYRVGYGAGRHDKELQMKHTSRYEGAI